MSDIHNTETVTPPPPPGHRPGPRRLWRSRRDRKLAGVCGGIAEYFHLDPVLIRLAAVALFLGGIGFILYPIAWLIIPKRPAGTPVNAPRRRRSDAADRPRGQRAVLSAIAVVGVTVLILSVVGNVSPLPLGILLIGAGVWFLTQERDEDVEVREPRPRTRTAPSTPPPAASGRSDEDARRKDPADMTDDELLAAAEWEPDAPFDDEYLEYDEFDDGIDGDPPGSRRRSRRGLRLAVAGALLVLAAMATPLIFVSEHIDEGVGDRLHRPTSVDELQPEYKLGAGVLELNLASLSLDEIDGELDVAVNVGVGEVFVTLPRSAGGQAAVDVGIGEIEVEIDGQRRTSDGIGPSLNVVFDGEDGNAASINLTVELEAGVVRVIR